MKFYKYQGAGNDFILFDPGIAPKDLEPDHIRFLCDRHFGIGADGVLFIQPSEKADFFMRIFNSDGSEAEMCGNGIRCFVKHLVDFRLTAKDSVQVQSLTGVHICRTFRDAGGQVSDVEVGMGRPRYDRSASGMEGEGTFVAQLVEKDGHSFHGTAVSMGNPHLVIFEGKSIEEAEIVGPLFESHPAFPSHTNVEFVEVKGPQHLKVVVYERGSGITLACGTGACASVAAAVIEKRIEPSKPVRVDLPGGALSIRISPETGEIWMTGPAVRVFEGDIDLGVMEEDGA